MTDMMNIISVWGAIKHLIRVDMIFLMYYNKHYKTAHSNEERGGILDVYP